MAVSTIGVADAASPDKYLHTWQRTISGTAREDQFIQQGWSGYPTYSVGTLVSAATGTAHALQLMGDGSNYGRVTRISIVPYVASAATNENVYVVRLSSAGTGGTAITVGAYDSADTYAGAAAYTPTSKGTEAATLWTAMVHYPTTGGEMTEYVWEWRPGIKPIIFGTATSSGIALKTGGAVTGGAFAFNVEFVVTPYL